jgi:hypothetical protein
MKLLKTTTEMMDKVPHVVIDTPAGKISAHLEAPNKDVAEAWGHLTQIIEAIDDTTLTGLQRHMLSKGLWSAQLRMFGDFYLCGSFSVENYPEGFTEDEEDRWDDEGRRNKHRFNKLHPHQKSDLFDEWEKGRDWFYTTLNRWN